MTPNSALKNGVHYRYYISTPLLHGNSEIAGSVSRVPAADLEETIVKALRERLETKDPADDRTLLDTHVARVMLSEGARVMLVDKSEDRPSRSLAALNSENAACTLADVTAQPIFDATWNEPFANGTSGCSV